MHGSSGPNAHHQQLDQSSQQSSNRGGSPSTPAPRAQLLPRERNLRPRRRWRDAPFGAGAPLAEPRTGSGNSFAKGPRANPGANRLGGLAALAWLSQRWEALVAWWQVGLFGKAYLKKRGSQLNPFLCKDSRPPGEVLELVWLGVQCWAGLVLRV